MSKKDKQALDWFLGLPDTRVKNMNLTQILMKHGFTDWSGEPAVDIPHGVSSNELTSLADVPHRLSETYRQALHLYDPSKVIMYIDRNKVAGVRLGPVYITTYIPVKDFLLNGPGKRKEK